MDGLRQFSPANKYVLFPTLHVRAIINSLFQRFSLLMIHSSGMQHALWPLDVPLRPITQAKITCVIVILCASKDDCKSNISRCLNSREPSGDFSVDCCCHSLC
jgi:hypothetical protein